MLVTHSIIQSKKLFKTTLAGFITEDILRDVIDCDGDGNIVEVNKLLNIPQPPAEPSEVKEYIKEVYKIDIDEKILNMYTYRTLDYFDKKEILYGLNDFEKMIRDKIENTYNEYITIEHINKLLNEMKNDNKKSNAINTIFFLITTIISIFSILNK